MAIIKIDGLAISAAMRTWVPVGLATGTGIAWPSQLNGWPSANCADGQVNTVMFSWPVPTGFSSLSKAVVIVAGTQGNLYRTVTTRFAATGEVENTHTDSIAYGTVALAGNIFITEDDVSAAFTGILAGDYGQLSWIRDATHASDTATGVAYVIALLLEYA